EDGIRDFHVTGVQTCALPISSPCSRSSTALSSTCGMKLALLISTEASLRLRSLIRHGKMPPDRRNWPRPRLFRVLFTAGRGADALTAGFVAAEAPGTGGALSSDLTASTRAPVRALTESPAMA